MKRAKAKTQARPRMHAAETPAKNPETPGELIESAREALGMSQNEAGGRLDISGNRWRDIVSGERWVAKGVRQPVTPKPETLARLAVVVGLSPQAFERLHPPRRDIAAHIRSFTADAQATNILHDQETARCIQLLITIREQFGEAVYEAAADALILGTFTRRGPDTRVDM